MPPKDKEILSQNYEFDNYPPIWDGGVYLPFPIFSIPGADMRDVSIVFAGIFDLGQVFQLTMLPIGELSPENIIKVKHIFEILRNIKAGSINEKEFPELVTICTFIASYWEEWINNPHPRVTENTRNSLIKYVDRLRIILYTELAKLRILVLEDKGGHSVKALWKDQFDFTKGITCYLSQFVKENIKEAARCLVLSCYTATGFHAMRSVECVSRKYYELVMGKPPIIIHNQGKSNEKHHDMGLGQIANDLLAKYNLLENHKPKKLPSGNLGLIGVTIQALCKNYRDPLSHPEIIELSEGGAITTFRHMIECINSIVNDAKAKGSHFINPWKHGILF